MTAVNRSAQVAEVRGFVRLCSSRHQCSCDARSRLTFTAKATHRRSVRQGYRHRLSLRSRASETIPRAGRLARSAHGLRAFSGHNLDDRRDRDAVDLIVRSLGSGRHKTDTRGALRKYQHFGYDDFVGQIIITPDPMMFECNRRKSLDRNAFSSQAWIEFVPTRPEWRRACHATSRRFSASTIH